MTRKISMILLLEAAVAGAVELPRQRFLTEILAKLEDFWPDVMRNSKKLSNFAVAKENSQRNTYI